MAESADCLDVISLGDDGFHLLVTTCGAEFDGSEIDGTTIPIGFEPFSQVDGFVGHRILENPLDHFWIANIHGIDRNVTAFANRSNRSTSDHTMINTSGVVEQTIGNLTAS